MTLRGLLVRGGLVLVIAVAAIAHKATLRQVSVPTDDMVRPTVFWKPTAVERLGPDPRYAFAWSDWECGIDTETGTYTRWEPGGKDAVAHIRLTRSERDSVLHAILAAGFFDWPSTLGAEQPKPFVSSMVDVARLTARAGRLEHTVTRFDTYGRDDDEPSVREAKARMTDIGDLIRKIAKSKSEVVQMPPDTMFRID